MAAVSLLFQSCKPFQTFSRRFPLVSVAVTSNRNYAVDTKKAKVSGGGRVKEFPVEKDPYRLVNYCCGSNYFIEGEDVKLKPEEEYPEWLWDLDISGTPKKLEELDPNSKEYWEKVREMAIAHNRRIKFFRWKVLRRFN